LLEDGGREERVGKEGEGEERRLEEKRGWGERRKGGYRTAIYTSVSSLHQPCPFGPCHAHKKNTTPVGIPTPPIQQNDLITPIIMNSSQRVALGCLCLGSGRNGTEDVEDSNGINYGTLGGFYLAKLSEA
jgi:hypothetical protein